MSFSCALQIAPSMSHKIPNFPQCACPSQNCSLENPDQKCRKHKSKTIVLHMPQGTKCELWNWTTLPSALIEIVTADWTATQYKAAK